MTESDFLSSYDPSAFERPSVAVDLALLTIRDRELHVLLVERAEHPFKDQWSLPGAFVGVRESLEHAAQRVLREKAGIPSAFLEQLYTFGDVDRDPRMRVIAVAYFALLPSSVLTELVADGRELARVTRDGDHCQALDFSGDPLQLAFDHGQIIKAAVDRLQAKLDWSEVAFALLPEEFTLHDLQGVHEVILGRPLNKPAFRTRMLATGRLQATGKRTSGSAFRPAELYRVREA